jgi:hypothetical protein
VSSKERGRKKFDSMRKEKWWMMFFFFHFPVALCVVTTGGGVLCARGGENSSEQLGQKLGSSIGVDSVRCATGKPYCVEEGGNEGGRGAVLEGEDKNGFREAVHDSQSFGLAGAI